MKGTRFHPWPCSLLTKRTCNQRCIEPIDWISHSSRRKLTTALHVIASIAVSHLVCISAGLEWALINTRDRSVKFRTAQLISSIWKIETNYSNHCWKARECSNIYQSRILFWFCGIALGYLEIKICHTVFETHRYQYWLWTPLSAE